MSKKVSFIIIAVILVLALVIPSNKVFAANKKVNEVNATQANGIITVSGTVEEGMLAVAVQVVDSSDKLVKLETGAVDSSNKYNLTIEVPEGTYKVKVADYEGGDVVEKIVTAEDPENNELSENKTPEIQKENESNNPQTGDMIRNTVITLFIAIIVLAVTFKFRKIKSVRKH